MRDPRHRLPWRKDGGHFFFPMPTVKLKGSCVWQSEERPVITLGPTRGGEGGRGSQESEAAERSGQ